MSDWKWTLHRDQAALLIFPICFESRGTWCACSFVWNMLPWRIICLMVESCPMFTDFNMALQQGMAEKSRTFFLTQPLILDRWFGFHPFLHQYFFFLLLFRVFKTNFSCCLMKTPVLTPALRSAESSQAARPHLEPEAILALSIRVQFWTTNPKGPASKIQAHIFLLPNVSKYVCILRLKTLRQCKEQIINDWFILSKA